MENMMTNLFQIIPANESHFPFILDSYLHRWNEVNTGMHKEEYYACQRVFIVKIINETDAKTYVATALDDINQLYGWIIASPKCFYWAYIKKAFRKQYGIWEALLKSTNLYGKETPVSYSLSSKYLSSNKTNLPKWTYSPSLLRNI
jgi:hypothetical protein